VADHSTATACRASLVLLLTILLAVATTGWVVTALKRDRPASPPAQEPPRAEAVFVFVPLFGPSATESQPTPEMVTVPVAAKDLPVGTVLRKPELSQFVVWKSLPRDTLPPHYVADEAELAGRMLTRAVLEHEAFPPTSLGKETRIYLPDGMDILSLPFPEVPVAGFVAPGSRVDIIATHKRGNQVEAFPLLDDVLVLAVSSHLPYPPDGMCSVSFAVDQQMALLVAQARRSGCEMEVLLRAPSSRPKTTSEDYKKRAKRLAELADANRPATAPAPREK